MGVLCSSHNLSQLKILNRELELHCYALKLIMDGAPSQWSETWYKLMFERIDFLEQTCGDLCTFESVLRQGKDLNPSL